MSIERFMAIYFPIRTKTLTSKMKIITTMTVTSIILSALNLHFFWTYEIKQGRTNQYCGSISKYSVFLRDYWPWITLAFYSLVPFTILICSSVAIILKIIYSNYVRKHKMNQKEGGVKMTSITLTLLTVSIVFRRHNGASGCIQVIFYMQSYVVIEKDLSGCSRDAIRDVSFLKLQRILWKRSDNG